MTNRWHKAALGLALGAWATLAAAQNLTAFGILDVSARRVTAGDRKLTQLATDGLQPSRLGFRGSEDLGDGYSAGFWLESGLAPDTGGTVGRVFWFRRSTVSLAGPQGELRLGRDYTPAFMGYVLYDPYQAAGVGALINLLSGPGGTLGSGAATAARADNTAAYFLPGSLGGVNGHLMVGAGEGSAGVRHRGLRLGYAAGPLDASVAYGSTAVAGGGEYRIASGGGSYQMGPLRLSAVRIATDWAPLKERLWMLGAMYSVGTGTLRVSYATTNASGGGTDANDARQLALGYVHHLSLRTALYGTYARIRNKGGAGLVSSLGFTPSPGQASSGLEFGVRHSF